MRPLIPLSLSSATLLAAAYLSTSASQKDSEGPATLRHPEGYRQWAHVKSMVISEGHPLYEAFGGIHHVYANEAALEGLQAGAGRYEDGAAFAFDLLEAESAENATTEGARKVLALMQRDESTFGETGGWGFAAFPEGSRAPAPVQLASACFDCHAPQAEQGYVFSTWRP